MSSSVILNFANTCLPFLTRPTLAKSVNSDEAAAMGAVYQAAANTRGFIVKRIVLRDMNNYAIDVCYNFILKFPTFPLVNTFLSFSLDYLP